jgi:hypothetical protein
MRRIGVYFRRFRTTVVFASDSNLRYLHAKVQHRGHTIDVATPAS